ncbi:hypothetical protein C900_02068 [Fulvivirga imtechensis AK7]|uniref:CYTH domain-containing protein n=1 Tax=Fulvivirga imtechensis AK7 TaxID=1237149 RepID=L8K165_9BACT|nr:hypothetical protein [Fulvivirga imtechensis]ELR73664.1 hypothetical protein C900_02068 [Fulvivirga imtechensis AK7]
MLSTTEIRWFFEEALPEEMQEWFEHFSPEDLPPRTDYYLNMEESAGVGIKLREGNIQIKPIKAERGARQFLENVEGNVSQYEKWSFPVTSNEEWPEMIRKPDVWIPAIKIRKLLRFTLGGGYPNKIGMEELVDEGCEVELSKVEVVDRTFWSLAFEAHGSTAQANLEKTVDEIFRNKACPIRLVKEKSFGYTHLIRDIQV